VPVSIVRNGLRTVAVGTGDSDLLELPYVAPTADVKVGDVLITSGMGGVFPEGIPVGVITESRRDPKQLLLRVWARPRVAMDNTRQVQALWFDRKHPAAPTDPKLLELPPAPVAQPVTTPPAMADAAAEKAKP
jgi:rod shape-determining protein MreC